MTTDTQIPGLRSAPATERLVLAYIERHGSAAVQLCAENGLTAADFTDANRGLLYERAVLMHRENRLHGGYEILYEGCADILQAHEILDCVRIDGTADVPSIDLPRACRRLKRLSAERTMERHARSMIEAVQKQDEDTMRKTLMALNDTQIESRPRATWNQTALVEIERAKRIIAGQDDEDVRSIQWPWPELNREFKPFRRGELVVIAGFASFGKSSLLRQLLLGSAMHGHNCALVSLEVPAGDIFNLMSAAASGQPWSRLKHLHPRDQSDFIKGQERVRKCAISVLDDTHNLDGIMAWLRGLHQRQFLDVIAIDYLGLISDCEPDRGQTKAHAVGKVAGAFKRLAAELGCVVLLAVQINRGPMNDGMREPRLTDLKDSGDIEAHADRALLLHRPTEDKVNGTPQNTHDPIENRPRFYMNLFQEKGRNVGTGSGDLWFNRQLARFEMIARHEVSR